MKLYQFLEVAFYDDKVRIYERDETGTAINTYDGTVEEVNQLLPFELKERKISFITNLIGAFGIELEDL